MSWVSKTSSRQGSHYLIEEIIQSWTKMAQNTTHVIDWDWLAIRAYRFSRTIVFQSITVNVVASPANHVRHYLRFPTLVPFEKHFMPFKNRWNFLIFAKKLFFSSNKKLFSLLLELKFHFKDQHFEKNIFSKWNIVLRFFLH